MPPMMHEPAPGYKRREYQGVPGPAPRVSIPAMEPTPPILQYATPAPQRKAPPLPRLFLILLLPGAVIPFVDFVDDITPFSAIFECINRFQYPPDEMAIGSLALSFFLAFPALAWKGLILARRPPRTWERWIGYSVAGVGSVPFGIVLGYLGVAATTSADLSRDWQGRGAIGWATVCLVAIPWLIVRLARHQNPRVGIYAWLLSIYVANTVLCLITFNASRLPLGYLLSMPVATAGLIELALLAVTAKRG